MENKKMIKNMLAVFVMVMAFAVTGITAHAASVTQTGLTTTSITVQWVPPAIGTPTAYYVGIGTDSTSARTQAESKAILVPNLATSYTFNNLTPGTSYYIYVYYDYVNSSGTSKFAQVGSLWAAVTHPAKVSGVKQTKWWYYIEKVDFSWNTQPAAKYEYIVKNNKGKKIYTSELTPNSKGSCGKVKNNSIYTVQVRAKVTCDGKEYYGDWSDAAYLFTQPMVSKASVSGGKLKVTWGKINGVTGYDIYVSTKEKKGYKKVKSVGKSKKSVTISKLKGKKFSNSKKYYVYIVAKKKVGKRTHTSGKHYTYEVKNKRLNWTFDK